MADARFRVVPHQERSGCQFTRRAGEFVAGDFRRCAGCFVPLVLLTGRVQTWSNGGLLSRAAQLNQALTIEREFFWCRRKIRPVKIVTLRSRSPTADKSCSG